MNCVECKEHQRETAPVPYTVHEGDMARSERSNKRLWILIILLILALIATNAAWIYYESQFEDITTTTTYEASSDDGGTAVANGEGSVNVYGQGASDQDDQNPDA